jgi:hypothetical protein
MGAISIPEIMYTSNTVRFFSAGEESQLPAAEFLKWA